MEIVTKKKVDWAAARNFYITNPTVTYEQVAVQFDAPLKTVAWHGQKESWALLRAELGAKVDTAIEGEVIKQAVDRNEIHATGAKNLQGLIQKKINIAYKKLLELEEKLESGETLSPYEKGIISDKGLSDLADAYVAAVNLERVTQGLPTSVERKEITGNGGANLFGEGTNAKLDALIVGAVSALAERRQESNSQSSD